MKKNKSQFSIYPDKSRNGIYYIYYYPEPSSDNSKKRLRKSLYESQCNEAFIRALKLINGGALSTKTAQKRAILFSKNT